MMSKFTFPIILLVSLIFSNQSLWDLGVIVEKDLPITYQKEMDINNLIEPMSSTETIKALHSNNFIPPIIQEIKNPLLNKNNIIKKYDDLLNKLSLSDKILSIKKSFLNKEFSSFFNFYHLLHKDNIKKDQTIDLMYIQNLYFSNQLDAAGSALNSFDINNLSDQLLLYKIKIDIKLKNIEEANTNIDYFIYKFPKSDLMPYVVYERKLIKNINHD